MSTMAAYSRFRIGGVFSRFRSILFLNIGPFALFALAGGLVPFFIMHWVQDQVSEMQAAHASIVLIESLLSLFVTIGMVALMLVAQTALYQGALESAAGRRPDPARMIDIGCRRFLKLFLIQALVGLGALLGGLFLLVPGIVLSVMWCCAPAVLIAEETGARAAMGRSAELTKGRRWGVFGAQFLFGFVAGLILLPLMLGMVLPAVIANIGHPEKAQASLFPFQLIVTFFSFLVLPAFRAGLYQELVQSQG